MLRARLGNVLNLNGPIQRIEPASLLLGHNILERQSKPQRRKTPDETSDWRSNKGTKDRPISRVETLLKNEELSTLPRVAEVDASKDEDGEQTAQAADHDLEATPPVELLGEAETENGNDGGGDEIADEVDLQDGRGLEGEDHDGDGDEEDEETDDPNVQLVAEQVVGGGGDHG